MVRIFVLSAKVLIVDQLVLDEVVALFSLSPRRLKYLPLKDLLHLLILQ